MDVVGNAGISYGGSRHSVCRCRTLEGKIQVKNVKRFNRRLVDVPHKKSSPTARQLFESPVAKEGSQGGDSRGPSYILAMQRGELFLTSMTIVCSPPRQSIYT